MSSLRLYFLAVFLVGISALPLDAATGSVDPAKTVELLPLPAMALDSLEPAVREKLQGLRQDLDARLAEGSADAAERAEAFYRLGAAAFLHELTATATVAFENTTRLAPDDDRPFYFLGLLCQQQGDFERAITFFEKALALRAGNVPAMVRLGDLHLLRQELDAAEIIFRKALAVEANEAAVHFGLGRVALARGELENALPLLRRALELQPEASSLHHPLGQVLRRLGRIEEAKAELAKAGSSMLVVRDPLRESLLRDNVSARALLVEGNRLRRRGMTEVAIERYRQALALDPQEAAVHYNLGITLAGRGELAAAERHFRAALVSRPGFRDAQFNLGICLREQKRFAEALTAFEEAARLDTAAGTAGVSAALEAAICRELVGDREGARKALVAIAAQPDLEVGEKKVLARYWLYLGEAEKALALRLETATQAPDDLELQLELAESLGRAGRLAEAADVLRRAGRLAPQDARVRFSEALALAQLGECAEAEKVWAAAVTAAGAAIPAPRLAEIEARLRRFCPR